MSGSGSALYVPTDRPHEVVWRPNPGAQTAFLSSPAREVLYGGAVSGGKTDAIIMDALRNAAHPKGRSIIFRRERGDLQEIIDRQRMVYEAICPGALWVESRSRWEWPSGAYTFIGSAQRKDDIEAYKSFEFDRVYFDELTTFMRYQYLYMLSRNRSKDDALPLAVRSGTNPDGPGHGWVFNRFVKDRAPYAIYRTRTILDGEAARAEGDGSGLTVELTQQFIPATIFDNPMVSGRDEYIAGLVAMGEQLANALLYGEWDYFQGQMFPYGPTGGLVEVERGVKQSGGYVVRALDYGWTDPTVVYWLLVYPRREGELPDIEIVEELAITETNVRDIARLIRIKEQRLQLEGVEQPTLSEIDPSTKATHNQGRSTLSLFEEYGIWFTPANNDRQAGWSRLRPMLEQGRIGVWKGRAPYLMHTLPKLVRDGRKADDIAPKQDDHGADTLRYAVMGIIDGMMPSTDATDPLSGDGPEGGRRDMEFDKWRAKAESLNKGAGGHNFDGLGEGF